MLPPAPQVPLPVPLPGRTSSKASEAHEKTFNIYMNSLNKLNDEPTLDDLDALRPPMSTVRAALEGVIGSGRALLPEGHPLHLAIEQLGAQEATVGGGPRAKRTVVAGTKQAKNMEYKALYAATEGTITRGFTVAQLKRFERETRVQKGYKKVELPSGKTTSKPRIIHSLMNSRWGMIHPKVVEGYIDNENKPVEQSYLVSPSELFIFLGRDGEDLLHLSEKLKMRINVDRQSPASSVDSEKSPQPDRFKARPGFIIRASGTKSNHEKLKKHIENQRDTMAIRVISLPTGSALSPSLLQSISRVSGAFVENVDPKFVSLHEDENSPSSVSITARSPRSAYTAERLVQRAAMEAAHRSQLPLFALLKDIKSPLSTIDKKQDTEYQAAQYAIYPFGTQGFRVRSVQQIDSASQNSPSSDVGQLPLTTGALDVHNYDKDEAYILTGEDHSESKSRVGANLIPEHAEEIVARNTHGEVVDLSEHIFGKSSGQGEKIVTVTFGHVVFKAGKTTVLDPPLPKQVSSDSMLEWANKHGSTARTFVPGQVPSADLPSNVTSIHRLQYRTIEGGHVINVDVELPGNNVEKSPEETSDLGISSENTGPAGGLELVSTTQPPAESTHEGPISSQSEDNSEFTNVGNIDAAPSDTLVERAAGPPDEHPSTEENPDATEFTPLPVEITVGTETASELMLPESTMDIYVQVSNTTSMAKSLVPEVLGVYLDGLSKFFTTDIEMAQPDPPQYLNFDGKHYVLVKNTSARSGRSTFVDLPPEYTVISESSLDLENNVHTVFTQLTCHSEKPEKDWDSFIRSCQTLASRPYERSTELRVSPYDVRRSASVLFDHYIVHILSTAYYLHAHYSVRSLLRVVSQSGEC
ncbi:hypothetical protein B0J17DRAFT_113020 [Rhizoctonia solani]|nr:hypothetical protein B0J17DRAFT_113020 [Rhizoctonia solani]